MKSIVIVVGTRPNFIKSIQLYETLNKYFNITLIHTGQHYDDKMSNIFFNQLNIKKPDIKLKLNKAGNLDNKLYKSFNYNQNLDLVVKDLINYKNDLGQLGEIRDKVIHHLKKINPDLVIVFGDVTSTLASALAAETLNIQIAHVESGLRSNDLGMPEEINRILVDHITEYYFITEQSGLDNLKKSGKKEHLYLVGNTMIDTQKMYLSKALNTKYYKKLNLVPKDYILVTLHRPSNVDNFSKFRKIILDLEQLNENIIFPIHPRIRKHLKKIDSFKIKFLDPLGYLEFTCLMANSKYVITDSGGIQEETTILNIPCFTLRKTTERPITLIENKGTNQLIDKIGDIKLIPCTGNISLWDGKTSERIAKILIEILN